MVRRHRIVRAWPFLVRRKRLRRLLTPVVRTAPRPTVFEPDRLRYLRAYLLMRTMIGVLAVALPLVLGVGDLLLSATGPFSRGSLSAYYYSGARDLFVGTLCAVAVFLVTYKVSEANLDNTLSLLAGVAAFGVALFPTRRPDPLIERLSPLQQRLGEMAVETVHYLSATVFIATLAVLCYFFGVREGARPRRAQAHRSPQFWRIYHWSCAAAIAVSVIAVSLSALTAGPADALVIAEVLSVWAFGASWLMKGLELDILRGARASQRSASRASLRR